MSKWRSLAVAVGISAFALTATAADWEMNQVGFMPLPQNMEVYSATDGFWGSEIIGILRSDDVQRALSEQQGALQMQLTTLMPGVELPPDYLANIVSSAEFYQLHGEDRKGIHTAFVVQMSLPVSDFAVLAKQGDKGTEAFWRDAFLPRETTAVRSYLAAQPRNAQELQEVTKKEWAKMRDLYPQIKNMDIEIRAFDGLKRHDRKRETGIDTFYETGMRFIYYENDLAVPIYYRQSILQRGDRILFLLWWTNDSEYDYFKPKIDDMMYEMRELR